MNIAREEHMKLQQSNWGLENFAHAVVFSLIIAHPQTLFLVL